MKGLSVKFKKNEWDDDLIEGDVITEPYPKISPSQLYIPRNGGVHVGSYSVTCVSIREGFSLHHDIPVNSLKIN